jgi:hypothetical protein
MTDLTGAIPFSGFSRRDDGVGAFMLWPPTRRAPERDRLGAFASVSPGQNGGGLFGAKE